MSVGGLSGVLWLITRGKASEPFVCRARIEQVRETVHVLHYITGQPRIHINRELHVCAARYILAFGHAPPDMVKVRVFGSVALCMRKTL